LRRRAYQGYDGRGARLGRLRHLDEVAMMAGCSRQEVMTMRPKVSFRTTNIYGRLQSCEDVARAHGWHPNDIIIFTKEVREAFSYEEAMAIIEREFETVPH
jgi:hypothetical protein